MTLLYFKNTQPLITLPSVAIWPVYHLYHTNTCDYDNQYYTVIGSPIGAIITLGTSNPTGRSNGLGRYIQGREEEITVMILGSIWADIMYNK